VIADPKGLDAPRIKLTKKSFRFREEGAGRIPSSTEKGQKLRSDNNLFKCLFSENIWSFAQVN
jgi:hypothetical protein